MRALNTFPTCCRGQRMGIFAGSGVGKSVLLSMLARNVAADVSVIGLIGERGREVQEFLQDDLGEDGLARSVVVVSTSDEPALMRRQAAYLTLAIAEYFRDEGKDVLVLMDFGHALCHGAARDRPFGRRAADRQGLYADRLHRTAAPAGAGRARAPTHGTITGIFTVLVDGDDHNEPIADAVRSILDGHIVMERAIAERGRYPAINVLKSVSRTMPRAADPAFLPVITRARQVMATYADMEELIRLGAYRAGSSAGGGRGDRPAPAAGAFLGQGKEEATSLTEGYMRLAANRRRRGNRKLTLCCHIQAIGGDQALSPCMGRGLALSVGIRGFWGVRVDEVA